MTDIKVFQKLFFISMFYIVVCFFAFLFGFFLSHLRNLNSLGDVFITGEGKWLQMFTYAQFSLPLSSEYSLACHTYCDMGHLFIIKCIISKDCTTCFTTQVCCSWVSNTQNSACDANALNDRATAAAYIILLYSIN